MQIQVDAESLRALLLRLLEAIQQMDKALTAHKAIIKFARPNPGEPSLQDQLETLIQDSETAFDARYALLFDTIRQLLGDSQLTQLLKQFPPQGGVQ